MGILALIAALAISGVAALYSILGLAAIFAGAKIPIIIMGGVLEVGSWLLLLGYIRTGKIHSYQNQ